MKLLKKILIFLFIVLIAIQAAFVYRRYKFGQLRAKIDEIAKTSQALPKPTNTNFNEFKGIIHAHTGLGGHSTGRFEELIDASNSNDLDFVVMTEHFSPQFDTSALTLNGVYGKTLFIGGNEIDTSDADRFLMIPGSAEAPGLAKMPTKLVMEKLHAENRLALVTYPERLNSWDANYDGVEVFNLHTAAKQVNPFVAFFDLLWSGSSYSELVFAANFRRPDENLTKYDAIAANRKVSLFAGTDAHSNIGFHIFGDDAGHKLIDLKLDRYATMFGIVRTHIQLAKDKSLTHDNLIDVVKQGRYFVGLDMIGDTSGFLFTAGSGVETKQMGDEVPLSSAAKLNVFSPASAHILIFKNGAKFAEEFGVTQLSAKPDSPGTYRVEVYQNALGAPFDSMPWIISNPIYVR